ncbi:uncharacterized protein LOC130634633 [Hydractinia symbiolongicarpus]|uniref:uncharacterized protein LOC130634633 n=1 Tax=Hydractinia symbiolongicarpus TaxID=13093 RepID=UPI00254D199A|nr:uncharacterized protein LOC130634633 [Hydractinia symbiolongicarpus]XP_057300621.1 uncharacterized protein LOC130634633 [Hydractinia symbiolongicarpus]
MTFCERESLLEWASHLFNEDLIQTNGHMLDTSTDGLNVSRSSSVTALLKSKHGLSKSFEKTQAHVTPLLFGTSSFSGKNANVLDQQPYRGYQGNSSRISTRSGDESSSVVTEDLLDRSIYEDVNMAGELNRTLNSHDETALEIISRTLHLDELDDTKTFSKDTSFLLPYANKNESQTRNNTVRFMDISTVSDSNSCSSFVGMDSVSQLLRSTPMQSSNSFVRSSSPNNKTVRRRKAVNNITINNNTNSFKKDRKGGDFSGRSLYHSHPQELSNGRNLSSLKHNVDSESKKRPTSSTNSRHEKQRKPKSTLLSPEFHKLKNFFTLEESDDYDDILTNQNHVQLISGPTISRHSMQKGKIAPSASLNFENRFYSPRQKHKTFHNKSTQVYDKHDKEDLVSKSDSIQSDREILSFKNTRAEDLPNRADYEEIDEVLKRLELGRLEVDRLKSVNSSTRRSLFNTDSMFSQHASKYSDKNTQEESKMKESKEESNNSRKNSLENDSFRKSDVGEINKKFHPIIENRDTQPLLSTSNKISRLEATNIDNDNISSSDDENCDRRSITTQHTDMSDIESVKILFQFLLNYEAAKNRLENDLDSENSFAISQDTDQTLHNVKRLLFNELPLNGKTKLDSLLHDPSHLSVYTDYLESLPRNSTKQFSEDPHQHYDELQYLNSQHQPNTQDEFTDAVGLPSGNERQMERLKKMLFSLQSINDTSESRDLDYVDQVMETRHKNLQADPPTVADSTLLRAFSHLDNLKELLKERKEMTSINQLSGSDVLTRSDKLSRSDELSGSDEI